MSLFGKFFKKNTPPRVLQPFPANEGAAQIREWFKTTKPWDMVSSTIIDALIEQFSSHNLLFEVFVWRSMENNLIDEYIILSKDHDLNHPAVSMPAISAVMARLGSASADALSKIMTAKRPNEAELGKHYSLARDSLEVAIVLDSNHITAYLALAQVLAMFGKEPEAINQATRGLAKINDINLQNLPLPRTMREGTDQLELRLTELLKRLQ